MSMDEMDTEKFPEENVDPNEDEEEIAELQPDFSAQEIKVEEVTVTQMEEVTETVEVVMTEETIDEQQDYDILEPGSIKGGSNLGGKELEPFEEETGEDAQRTPLAEMETALHGPTGNMEASDQEGADGSRRVNLPVGVETFKRDSGMTRGNGNQVMTERDETVVDADEEALKLSMEEATILQQSESGDKETILSGGIVNDHPAAGMNGHNEKAMEGDDEPGKEQATGVADDSGPGGAQIIAPAASLEQEASGNGESKQVDDNNGVKKDSSIEEGGEPSKEGNAPGGNEQVEPSLVVKSVAHVPSSAQKMPTGNLLGSAQAGVEAKLGSASTSVSLFSDAMQAQLRAQILVLGAFRKGTKPSLVLVKTACLPSSKGATIVGASSSALHPERNQEGVSTVGAGPVLSSSPGAPPSVSGGNNAGFSPLPSNANQSNLPSPSQKLETTMPPSLSLTEATEVTVAMGNDVDASNTPTLAEASSKRRRKSHKNNTLAAEVSQQTAAAPLGHPLIPCDSTMAVRPNPNQWQQHTSQATEDRVHDATDKQLHLAQSSAQDAMTTATSALAQSHMAWARIRSQNPSELGNTREYQIASVAATVAAAASVAKAAVEAAKAIADMSIEACMQAGVFPGVAGRARTPQLGLRSSQDALHMANGSQSAPQGKTRKNSKVATAQKGDMLDCVVRAAGMAAEAQAGAVLAMANPLTQANCMDGLWARRSDEVEEADERATRPGAKKGSASKGKGVEETTTVNGSTPKRHKSHVGASPVTTSTEKVNDASRRMRGVLTRGKEAADGSAGGKRKGATKQKESSAPLLTPENVVPQPALREPRAGRNTEDKSEKIVEGSAVEVMSEEEGLRGGWFSGKVLRVTEKEAFVVYDELLTDDGTTHLKEWFPFEDAHGGNTGARRQVRPVHPYSLDKDAGSKKRRRLALGSQTWIVGDHVDAFVQDGWWEGVIVQLNDMDQSKATVCYPGYNGTQVVKTSDLRPSLQWTDSKWMPLMDSSVTEDERPEKRRKVGGSSSTAQKDEAEKMNFEESSSKAKKAKAEKRSLHEPSGKIVEPPTRRATRRSTDGKKQGSKSSTKSNTKTAGEKRSEIKNTKTASRAHQQDVTTQGTPKELNFDVDTTTPTRSAKKLLAPEGRAPATRGKVRAASEDRRQSSRKLRASKVG